MFTIYGHRVIAKHSAHLNAWPQCYLVLNWALSRWRSPDVSLHQGISSHPTPEQGISHASSNCSSWPFILFFCRNPMRSKRRWITTWHLLRHVHVWTISWRLCTRKPPSKSLFSELGILFLWRHSTRPEVPRIASSVSHQSQAQVGTKAQWFPRKAPCPILCGNLEPLWSQNCSSPKSPSFLAQRKQGVPPLVPCWLSFSPPVSLSQVRATTKSPSEFPSWATLVPGLVKAQHLYQMNKEL